MDSFDPLPTARVAAPAATSRRLRWLAYGALVAAVTGVLTAAAGFYALALGASGAPFVVSFVAATTALVLGDLAWRLLRTTAAPGRTAAAAGLLVGAIVLGLFLAGAIYQLSILT